MTYITSFHHGTGYQARFNDGHTITQMDTYTDLMEEVRNYIRSKRQ